MSHAVTNQDLVRFETQAPVGRPHVVVLGAGASLAACPTGDAEGRKLPLMADLVKVLDLYDVVKEAGQNPQHGFEVIYSRLFAIDADSSCLQEIERRVREYFTGLELPDYPNVYDLVLLSLREKDAVFTFNWDPFLVDAYVRNSGRAPLPHIFHLHGNVRVSFCAECKRSMLHNDRCPFCGGTPIPSKLLYPVETKDYASDLFIKTQWHSVRNFLGRAFIVTIFGYSAPVTDQEALRLFTKAWQSNSRRKFVERVEIIDVRDGEELGQQWSKFAFFDHYGICRSFHESLAALYPRRSCEALVHMGVHGKFVDKIGSTEDGTCIQKHLDRLVDAERQAAHRHENRNTE